MAGSFLLYTLRRLAAALVIAALVSAITFVMLRVLRPESFPDPRPLPTELGEFLWGVFTQFDLGNSRQPPFRPVGELILERIGADVSLFLGAFLLGGGAGVAGGVVVSRAPDSPTARVLRVLALLGLCAPVYWTGLLAILLFGSGVGRVIGLGIVDTGIYQPLLEDPLAWLRSLIVPWIVTGWPLAAICLRLTAATMRDAGEADFVRTAFGKGVSARRVAYRHTLPTAISPTLSLAGAYLPLLVGNALLVEQVFNIPGVFRYTTSAVSNGDFPVMQGLVLVGAFMVVLGNLAADLVLARLDPRLRAQ